MSKLRAIIPHPTDPTLALVKLTRGMWSVIDAADAVAVGSLSWYAHPSSDLMYAARRLPWRDGKRGTQFLQDYIAMLAGLMGPSIDHKNGNALDNRRSNLRGATKSQQMQNTRIRRNNTSGTKGVAFVSGKWRARIVHGYREIHLGRFDTEEEAIAARRRAEASLFGAFSRGDA